MAKSSTPDMFATILPMLLDERPVNLHSAEFWAEIKLDGWRCLAGFGNGSCRLKTKEGVDCTKWFPEITKSLAQVPGGPHIADGEMVVLDALGRSDFPKMQARGLRKAYRAGADLVTFAAFDLLQRDGVAIVGEPLRERKRMLSRLLTPVPQHVLVVGHFDGAVDDLQHVFEKAVKPLGLEGLVVKRPNSVYLPGHRSADWVKVKYKGWMQARGNRPQA